MMGDQQGIEKQLDYFVKGGFAPVIDLLREFHYDKTGIVLEGLHFSAFSLLKHMDARQEHLLNFLKDPASVEKVWEEAYWPTVYEPKNEKEWTDAIEKFENDLLEISDIVRSFREESFKERKQEKSLFWAAVTIIQHNAYHIGQIKTIGRQLGVW